MHSIQLTPTVLRTLATAVAFILLLFQPIELQAQKEKKFRTNGQEFMHQPRAVSIEKNLLCLPTPWRSIDGTCNNRSQPARGEWGSSDIPLYRSMTADYGQPDTYNDMAGQNRLSPRAISNYVCAQNGDIPSRYDLSSFVFTWGQFLDHDIDLTPEAHTEFDPIPLPNDEQLFTEDIPFFRSAVHDGTGDDEAREQTNLITSWIDASNVYGSDQDRADWLRTFNDGKLKTSAGNLLPYNTTDGELTSPIDPSAPSMAGDNGGMTKIFVAGDVRAAEQPGLTSLHTLFVREHNRQCDRLMRNGISDDEELYQTARKHVGALIQRITYEEFLPALGIRLDRYRGYRSNVQPDITNLFATAAYRLGHTMVTDEMLLLDRRCNPIDGGTLSLIDAFFNPDVLATYNVEPIFRGLAMQTQQEIDVHIVDNLRNFLFAVPGGGVFGLDLASLNIQRGRDHGLPDYNTVREKYVGNRVSSFAQINPDPAVIAALDQAYQGDVDNMDAWVGMLAERQLRDKSVGPTLHAILKEQFENLRDGDFFYYEWDPYLDRNMREDIERTRLSEIIERNTDIRDIQRNVFRSSDCERQNNNGGGNNNSGNNGRNGSGGDAFVDALAVHPNPSSGLVVLDLEFAEAGLAEIRVFNAAGKTVYQDGIQVYSGPLTVNLDLSNEKKGLYLIHVTTESGSMVKRLSIQ